MKYLAAAFAVSGLLVALCAPPLIGLWAYHPESAVLDYVDHALLAGLGLFLFGGVPFTVMTMLRRW